MKVKDVCMQRDVGVMSTQDLLSACVVLAEPSKLHACFFHPTPKAFDARAHTANPHSPTSLAICAFASSKFSGVTGTEGLRVGRAHGT